MNSVNLVGRITRDLELQKTNSGRPWVRFTVAVNRNSEEADFIGCVAWDQVAENLAKYQGKGSLIGVSGRIQTGSYEKEGKTVYTFDVVAARVDFLSSPNTEEAKDGLTAKDNLPF